MKKPEEREKVFNLKCYIFIVEKNLDKQKEENAFSVIS